MYLLEVNDVSKTIGKKKILENVSFNLKKGKVLGLIGNNGAGKSSLLKAITGLYRIDTGYIGINGLDLTKEPFEALKHVGATIENNEFYDFLSGYDNLYIYSDNKDDIFNTASFVGIKEVMNKKVKTYSLGMKTRLSLAIALINNPDLIILDEPTNGLDPSGVIEFRNKILTLKESGKGILISSHILSDLEKICDDVIFIDSGRIIRHINNSSHKCSLEKIYKEIERNNFEKIII